MPAITKLDTPDWRDTVVWDQTARTLKLGRSQHVFVDVNPTTAWHLLSLRARRLRAEGVAFNITQEFQTDGQEEVRADCA